MVTDEQIKRLRLKIAELQGYQRIPYRQCPNPDHTTEPHWHDPAGEYIRNFPNWPTDRNASYELPVKNKQLFFEALVRISILFIFGHWEQIQTAYFESLAWLLYKGWRWVECGGCVDGKVNTIEIEQESVDCLKCEGEGGEWMKEN